MAPKVTTVVLDGGPCGGKTTAQAIIQQEIFERGVPVIAVPETATELIMAGVTPSWLTSQFQPVLLERLLQTEDYYRKVAQLRDAERVLLLFDRGAMSAKAYMGLAEWEALLQIQGFSEVDLRERRYDGVIHMRTAALGAQQFYTCANNAARKETPEEARQLDERTLQAWLGHPHLRVLDNSMEFDVKVRRAVSEVCHILGVPEPLEIERKYRVEPIELTKIPVPWNEFRIVQTYLRSREPQEERRIRARGQNGSWIYYETIKRPAGNSLLARVESERIISEREYVELSHDADPTRWVIRKRRITFIWKNRCFELDIFEYPRRGLHILEVELSSEDEVVELPPFLSVIEEVTGDPEYRNASMALMR